MPVMNTASQWSSLAIDISDIDFQAAVRQKSNHLTPCDAYFLEDQPG